MVLLTEKGATVFNGQDIGGNAIPVDNSKAATWSAEMENAVDLVQSLQTGSFSGALVKTSLSALNSDLAHDADSMAWVIGDSTQGNDGVYQKQGASSSGSWTRIADLPYGVIKLNNGGSGTANNLVAASSLRIPDSSYGALMILNLTATNTGAMTLAVNGETAKPIVTNSGNSIVSGYFSSGRTALLVDDGTNYRLLTDGDASASAAAAETARDEAEAARDAALVAAYGVTSNELTKVSEFAAFTEMHPVASFDFRDNIDDFDGNNATISSSFNRLSVEHTSANGGIVTDYQLDLGIDGSRYKLVALRIKILSGGTFDKSQCFLYYKTDSHNFDGGYYAQPVDYNGTELDTYTDGDEFVLYFDMTNLTAGGTDWETSTIDRLRFDLDEKLPRRYVIYWIRVLSDEPSTQINENSLTNSLTAPNTQKLIHLDHVNPEWWGMGEAATATTNSAALVLALSEDKSITLPKGEFNMSNIVHQLGLTDDAVIVGQGEAGTILNFGSENGLELEITQDASQMQGDKTSIIIENMSFQTEKDNGTGTGLHINYPDTLAGTGAGTSVIRRLKNLAFSGSSHLGDYWSVGLKITNGSYFNITNIIGSGPEDSVNGWLLYMEGGKNSVDNKINDLQGRRLDKLAYMTGRFEGLTFKDPIGVQCNTGLQWLATLEGAETSQPWLRVSGGHFNVYDRAIRTNDVTEMNLEGTRIFLAAANAIGVLAQRSSATSGLGEHVINGLSIKNNGGHAGQAGIQLDAWNGSSVIANNLINGTANGIVLLANCNNCTGSSNLCINNTTELVNSGTDNTVAVV